MANKGEIMSQAYHERQSKLLGLYKVSLIQGEMSANEAVIALKMIGFSETIAQTRVREWAALSADSGIETDKERKQRLKQIASLEKYVLQSRLGKKYYLRLKFMRNEIAKEEAVKKLIKMGYKEEIAVELINDWEAEK